MTLGLNQTNLANKWLNILATGTAFPSPPTSGLFFKLHTGDPSAAGTANASAVTTRVIAPYALGSSVIAQTGTNPQWTMTASETISHVSVWDALTGGNCLFTFALATAQPVVNTNTFTINTYSLSLAPIAV